jgi:PiT family inorganic phosphate transporter
VASAIGGIVTIGGTEGIDIIAAALFAAVAWNLVTWRWGLPSSSGHALVGGLVGAAVLAGGTGAVRWGGLDGIHPVGVLGACVALAVSPPLGALAAFVLLRAVRRATRRASRRWHELAQAGQWATSATLAFSHGANDAQKSAGIIAALLLADGRVDALAAPLWATIGCAAALTLGTAAGGWTIVRTVGRRIYHLHPVDGLCSQGASAAVILGASLLGAPTSTTQIVASSVVGRRSSASAPAPVGGAGTTYAGRSCATWAYRAALGALAELDDRRAMMGRLELYRRCSRMGESVVDVAERLIYAVLKEN